MCHLKAEMAVLMLLLLMTTTVLVRFITSDLPCTVICTGM